ncbi:hypothetical protein JET14_06230 [Martelella lutilitoris]|uniref:Uncharacterized protein n=1 Tax=Martelella lutilitoris TaxID=2583532 RepID=A0A7T7KMG1_9HYPH|nr:hypothetical protein [Martelella lutilitoris]QQM31761.1 hypothetical protein JET14_06230 [Martelella lutilitoris]
MRGKAGISFARLVFTSTAFMLTFLSGPQTGFAGDWSFQEHPQPSTEISFEELLYIDGDWKRDGMLPECGGKVRRSYEIYLKYFPEYAETAEPEQAYQTWRDYILADEESSLGGCMTGAYAYAIETLYKRDPSSITISYCGRFSGEPTTEEDLFVVDTIRYLEGLADKGFALAQGYYLLMDGNSVVRLNPDILFFLGQSLDGSPWAVELGLFVTPESLLAVNSPNLEGQPSPERKAFVDEAVARSDLASVLETTGPCGDMAWREAD